MMMINMKGNIKDSNDFVSVDNNDDIDENFVIYM